MAGWPGTLPEKPQIGGFTTTYESSVREFQPDIGPPIRRRAASDSFKIWSGTYRFSEAQLATFWTFYNVTISNGLDQFTMTDPNTDTAVTVEFVDAAPPEARAISYNLYEMTLRLRVRA